MKQEARSGSRELVRLSSTLAACMVHDAGAAGKAVESTCPVTLRALKRGFLRLLADTRREVAAGLGAPTDEPAEAGQTYNLALGFDRYGRGVFLLRRAAEMPNGAQAQLMDELRQYLRSLPVLPEEAS